MEGKLNSIYKTMGNSDKVLNI